MEHVAAWQSFYVIVGSAAAGLTGLMFVVITLTAGRRVPGADGPFAAFNTPTVVHFGAVLLVAAILTAPWPELWQAGLLLGLCGLGGVAYAVIVARRTRRQTAYTPVLEDWLFHAVLPFVSYMALVVATIVLPGNPVPALFVIGAAVLLLLFIGIHNAWDSATFTALVVPSAEDTGQD